VRASLCSKSSLSPLHDCVRACQFWYCGVHGISSSVPALGQSWRLTHMADLCRPCIRGRCARDIIILWRQISPVRSLESSQDRLNRVHAHVVIKKSSWQNTHSMHVARSIALTPLHRGRCNHCSIDQPSMTRRSYISPGGTSSWGMSVARDPKTGKFHGFVSEFVNGCKLGSWTSNSCVPMLSMVAIRACVHASHALPRALAP
jgi:hypothetical protein